MIEPFDNNERKERTRQRASAAGPPLPCLYDQ